METANINIKINFQQIVEAVKQLSPKEKQKLSDVIWEDDFEVPVETQKIVLDRIAYARKHPETMLDWEEASKLLID